MQTGVGVFRKHILGAALGRPLPSAVYMVFRWNGSVGFSKRSYLVKHEVLSDDTEVLSGETVFLRIGPLMSKRSSPVKHCFSG